MNILVYLEEHDGALKRASLEALTAAQSLRGDSITGVIVEGSEATIHTADSYGMTRCLNVKGDGMAADANDRIALAVAKAAQACDASIIVLPATAQGKDIAPRVAVKLEAGLLPDCVALEIENGTLIAQRPVYAGKALIKIKATTPTAVVTLRPNVFTAKQGSTASVQIETLDVAVPSETRSARVVGTSKNEGSMDVLEADIIVSGGRGLKGPEHFHLVESLARSLGAAVGASRAVVDAGWRPHREQVGQTGKTVSPSMYVACGISGAVQHLAGMSSSKVIVAINKDKEAPIFKVADYGLVGDVFEILPKLTNKISAVTGKS
jgi:electron transfer flavoprotein alpha subunit